MLENEELCVNLSDEEIALATYLSDAERMSSGSG